MNKQAIIEEARRIIVEMQHETFVLATVSPDGKPHIRYMGALILQDPLTLYMESGKSSRKVRDIHANCNVELLLARADYSRILIIDGASVEEQDRGIKQTVWDAVPSSGEYFSGIDDPEFVVMKVEVNNLQLWMDSRQEEPFVAEIQPSDRARAA